MNRIASYKCTFETNGGQFKFALTSADGGGESSFVVADPDAAETLMRMFAQSTEVHFDSAAGELTFSFSDLRLEEQQEEDDDEEEEKEEEGKKKKAKRKEKK